MQFILGKVNYMLRAIVLYFWKPKRCITYVMTPARLRVLKVVAVMIIISNVCATTPNPILHMRAILDPLMLSPKEGFAFVPV